MKRLVLLILVEVLIISQTIYAGWIRTYGLHESTEEGLSLVQTDDGGYLIIGYTTLWGSGGKDIWLLRIDSLGDTLWTRTYGGPDDDYPAEISPTEDGNYLISAYSSSLDGVWFLKINRIGDTLWTHLHKRLEGESPP
ncbi:MAG: hypothetical protein U9Q76_03945, partial [candidate division WOR-3 bacterium]|nr:hypothetical protein [candidate division WOR-3 bacterium]